MVHATREPGKVSGLISGRDREVDRDLDVATHLLTEELQGLIEGHRHRSVRRDWWFQARLPAAGMDATARSLPPLYLEKAESADSLTGVAAEPSGTTSTL
jgi:hypothetical protein